MNKTLRQLRIEKGWTLKVLGTEVGKLSEPAELVSPGIVSGWELTGRCHPSVVPILATVFGITPEAARQMMEFTEAAASDRVAAEAAD